MSDREAGNDPALTPSGRERRRFLERTALTAGTTAAAAALLPLAPIAAQTTAPAPQPSCPDIPKPMAEVAGKVAFVTGGNSGIGLGIARAFADAGMKVAITYRSREHLEEALDYLKDAGDRIHAINVDVTDREAMARAAEDTVRVFGKVHVLVNNAGVGILVPLSLATYDDWDWGMGVNLNGVFNGVRSFLPHIRAHGEGGHIVTTSSMSGLVAGGNAGVYTTSKFAVVGMMEALRQELRDTNIGVSVYCPGFVNTNIARSNRNRPEELSDTGLKMDPRRAAAMAERMRDAPPGPGAGMDPLDAGEYVLRGIRNNDLYILSHPEFEQGIRDRNEALIASIPQDAPPAPPERLEASRAVLRSPVYYEERDRKLCERALTKKS